MTLDVYVSHYNEPVSGFPVNLVLNEYAGTLADGGAATTGENGHATL